MRIPALTAAALLLLAGNAQADEEFRLPSNALEEPGAFGRAADNARLRPGAIAAPGGGPLSTPPARRPPLRLSPPAPAPSPRIRELPEPSRPAARRRPRESRRTNPLHFVPGVLLAALLFALRGGGESPGPAPQARPVQPARRPHAPRPHPPAASAPPLAPEPASKPPEDKEPAPGAGDPPPFDPPRPARWWALTWQEQLAIDRWDRSVEKEFVVFASLEEWLDAHAKGLPKVDVALLKTKLRRDA